MLYLPSKQSLSLVCFVPLVQTGFKFSCTLYSISYLQIVLAVCQMAGLHISTHSSYYRSLPATTNLSLQALPAHSIPKHNRALTLHGIKLEYFTAARIPLPDSATGT